MTVLVQDTVAVFLESIEGQISSSPQFKEFLFCGDNMSDILLTAALEAVTPGCSKEGASHGVLAMKVKTGAFASVSWSGKRVVQLDTKCWKWCMSLLHVNAGSRFSETASCLWFCARLLLMFVTKCVKNQQVVATHPLIEPLLRDVLPFAATVEQQLLIVEILCASPVSLHQQSLRGHWSSFIKSGNLGPYFGCLQSSSAKEKHFASKCCCSHPPHSGGYSEGDHTERAALS